MTKNQTISIPHKILGFVIISILVLACSPKPMSQLGYKTKFVSVSKNTPSTKISKAETTNQQFQFFLDATNESKYRSDSTAWQVLGGYTEPMQRNYHQHPAFNDYPVVNITHEAAMAYCAWLTSEYNSKSSSKVLFRLPTAVELNQLILARKSLLDKEIEADCCCDYPANLKYVNPANDSINYVMDGALFTSSVKKFKQKGIYSLLGNVSEICQDGSVIGGNWDRLAKDIENKLEYTYPDPRIGFRVVMEIL